jgi:uncharacterized protein YndB with AHSA1/START domain
MLVIQLAVRTIGGKAMAQTGTQTQEFTLTRTIDAPLDRVWQAWADADLIADWWGPRGFSAAVHRLDFREGGSTHVSMSAPAFGSIYNTWTYTRIVPGERIEFDSRFADSEGRHIDPIAPGVPEVVPHVVTFRHLGDGRTELSITESGYSSDEAMSMSRAGQDQVLNKFTQTAIRQE